MAEGCAGASTSMGAGEHCRQGWAACLASSLGSGFVGLGAGAACGLGLGFFLALAAFLPTAAAFYCSQCSILSRLRERERSRRLTDTWAANTPCWVGLGELGWKGCADEEILLFSCGLSPPPPPECLPSKAPPPRANKPKPQALPPPPPTQQTEKLPHPQAQVLRIQQQLIVGPGTPPWTWERGKGLKGKQPQ